jgi:8-oxo-dGTP diphosphatase
MIIAAAGGIVFDESRRLLLIKRGRPPSEGTWSVPGGKCEPGETPELACIREVHEETGLRVSVIRLAGRVSRAAPGGATFDIADFNCQVLGGELAAGDDAADVGWFARSDLAALPLAEGLYDALDGWGLLPR